MDKLLTQIHRAENRATKIIEKAEQDKNQAIAEAHNKADRSLKSHLKKLAEENKKNFQAATAKIEEKVKRKADELNVENIRHIHSAEKHMPAAVEKAVEAFIKFKLD